MGGRQVSAKSVTVDSVQIGDEQLRAVPVRVLEMPKYTDAIIGLDFFLSHRIFVSNLFHKMYFTYEGGPSLGVIPVGATSSAPVATTEPGDAAGYAARAAMASSRRDYAAALADLDRAIAMAPDVGRYFYQRAGLQLALQKPALAAADLSAARKLAPTDPEILLAHSRMAFRQGDRKTALEDAKMADKEVRLTLAQTYDDLGEREAAITNFDTWLSFRKEDGLRATALNGRCYSRAVLNRDLDKALSDCNEAVRLAPNNGYILDSRGLVHLRRGENKEAVADYTAALKASPNHALWRYERSIAEAKLGQADAAKSDREAAVAADPKIIEAAAKIGL
jgi:tetratricopeptide (TPR) repeat protein